MRFLTMEAVKGTVTCHSSVISCTLFGTYATVSFRASTVLGSVAISLTPETSSRKRYILAH